MVVSSWKGKPYVKSLPRERKSAPTPKEMINRNKWAMAQAWLRPVTKFVREGFMGYTPTVEGFIAAKSYLLKNAFEGVAPDLTINPALVKVSCGELPLPANITVHAATKNTIQFSWSTEHSTGERKYDQVMLLAYDIVHGHAFHQLTGELRKTGNDKVQVHIPEGKVYHLYIAFVSADRTMRSDSLYLGTIQLQPE
jgi:hypothetical protein